MSSRLIDKIKRIKESRLSPGERIFLDFTFGIDIIEVKNQNSNKYYGIGESIIFQYHGLTNNIWVCEQFNKN